MTTPMLAAVPPTPPAAIWKPFPGFQRRVLAAQEFEILEGGAKGPGKSDLIIIKPLAQVHRERFKALILRETWGELQELLDRTHRLYPRLEHNRPAWHGGEMRWRFPSGAKIQFGYAKRVEDVSIHQGKEWGFVGYDEIGNVKDPSLWTTLLAEVRCPDPAVRRQAMGSANPGKAGHPWLRRRFIVPCGEHGDRVHWERFSFPDGTSSWLSRRFIPGTVYDNPIYANDALYMATLMSLPERDRNHLLYGRWDVASGMALEELDQARHFVPPFTVPLNWGRLAGFDWGFAHPWVFIHAAVNEDGRVFVVDTVRGRRQHDPDICERITQKVGPTVSQLPIAAGTDCFQDKNTPRYDNTPSHQERFAEAGIFLSPANTARALGLANLRQYLAWRGQGPDGKDAPPMLVFMDTPGNRWLFEQLEQIVLDEANPEDALKVDANAETGEGGDDGYDCLRYLMAARPFRGRATVGEHYVSAFDPAVLAYETDRRRRGLPLDPQAKPQQRRKPTFSFGELG